MAIVRRRGSPFFSMIVRRSAGRLMGMEEIALHVQDRDATRGRDLSDVAVADAPVDVADRDPVVVSAEDLADLLRRVAVGDLGRPALDELGMPAELGHAGFERGAGPGRGEEEQHRQDLVPQERVGDAERPLALQLERHVENGVDLLPRPLLEVDQVSAAEVRLHRAFTYSAAPRTSASSAIRSDTPLDASTQ